MRIEEKRELPINAKLVWDYCMDMRNLPLWYSGIIESFEPETGSFNREGDTFRFIYRTLGRRVEMKMTIEEIRESDFFLRSVVESPALPMPVHQVWQHHPLGNERDRMEAVFESDDPTTFFGKVIDRTILPGLWRRDLIRSLETLEELAKVGLPE